MNWKLWLCLISVGLPLLAQSTPESSIENNAPVALSVYPGDAKVTVNWLVSESHQSLCLFVERSTDGSVFTVVSEFRGKAANGTASRFEFVDGSVRNSERYFYRITSIDAAQQLWHSAPAEVRPQPFVSEK